jgi:hypothetical protein
VHTGLHPGIECADGATGLSQASSDLDFVFGSRLPATWPAFIRNPGKNVARKQTHSDPD